MRHLLGPLLAAFFIVPAQAEEQPICGDRDTIVSVLEEKYGEHRVVYATDSRGVLMELFANPRSQSWTMLLTKPGFPTCAVGAGQGIEVEWPPGANA